MPDPRAPKKGKFNLQGRRLLVVGLAREGTSLARYLNRKGARVVATDLKPRKAFGDTLTPLAEAGVELILGEHPKHLLDDCEVVFVSPGVPFNASFLDQARARGVPLSTESRLFCQLCPARIVAITGSSGKSTTTTLVGEMLKEDAKRARHDHITWVGGNIGRPLIDHVDQIQPDDTVVMELSSFQLEYFHPSANEHVDDCHPAWLPLLAGWSPSLAAVLNITPNHLDRHQSMEAYIYAKRSIVDYRQPRDTAVVGMDDEIARAIGQSSAGRVRWFSAEPAAIHASLVSDGAYLSGPSGDPLIVLRSPHEDTERSVCQVSDIRLRGRHNVSNVLAACAIADTLGVSIKAMREVLTTFDGVEHRLELVDEVKGVRYYNDSIATSPERLIAALKAFDEPIVLIAGGRDKHLPWDEAAYLMLQRARHIILFGESVELIAAAIEAKNNKLETDNGKVAINNRPMLHRCVTLEDAVAVAAQVARPSDVVLLSPGCTSFDAFQDFAERGERFRQYVKRLAAGGGMI